MRLLLYSLLPLLLAPLSGAFHEALAREIAKLDQLLLERPADAELHRRRGDAYRRMRRWPEALADLNAAARHAPDDPETLYLLARLFTDSGWERKARGAADAFVAQRPKDARGRALRARIHAAAGDGAAAELDFDAAIAHATPADPDLYVQRARVVAGRGGEHRVRALAGLDAGITTLGQAPGLVHLAIELEMQLGRFDAALARHDTLASFARR
ncbi:MAG: tetratricopeptide repeat protein [bacterium]|nr:tetratricopeptide repeat protein [bacterium]